MTDKGFTVIEIMVVVALMAGMALMAAPFIGSRVSTTDVLDGASRKAADALYEARSSAMAGRNNARYGVHFETSAFTFFEGSSYVAEDEGNLSYDLPGDVTASAITITGGGSDIRFASHKGIPEETGSITFSDGAGNSKVLSVNAAGMIAVE